MKRVWVALVGAACATDAPNESQLEAYGTEQQGTEQQGTEQQGTEQQGTEQQGGGYVGTQYEDTTYVSSSLSSSRVSYYGATVTSVALDKTTLELWKRNANGTWTQRLPKKICTWDAELSDATCTTVSLATQASPLAGARFWSTFKRADGTTFLGAVQIGISPNHVGAVKVDPSYAMHPLTPSSGVNTCSLDITCDHPTGCRHNCDLFVYDLRLYDVYDTKGQLVKFCPNSDAYALPGTWAPLGQRLSTTSSFTFACMNGTLAKCTKWGYRPFGTAKDSSGVSESLASYHQSCIRAARADYCGVGGSGHSFTKNGTLIDIHDYLPYDPNNPSSSGFIPQAVSYLHGKGDTQTMYVWESAFDNKGATSLDFLRYSELRGTASYGSLEDPELGCPDRFPLGWGAPPGDFHRPRMRDPLDREGAIVSVDSTTICAHTEYETGRWLHWGCSACTQKLAEDPNVPLSCTRETGSWDASCKAAAAATCTPNERMGYRPELASSLHGECSTGTNMHKYASACTFRVCSTRSSCCSSTWDSTCVGLADQQCTGGRERTSPLGDYGFCGAPSPPTSGG